MSDLELYSLISTLPADLKQEVSDFATFLKQKASAKKQLKERHFGYAKGAFKMSADFNAPLDDFKEYM